MRYLLLGLTPLLTAFQPALSSAQDAYPTKALRWIVPLPPGGGADLVARTIAQKLGAALGQPVVIDNRGGGGTIIGAALAAQSPADGYTLFLGTATTHAINSSLHKTLPYDPIRDFLPVTLVANLPLILVVHPSMGVSSTKELISLAKSKPGQLLYGSSGNGSALQLAAEMLNTRAGIKIVHVPYKGSPQAVTALLAGDIQCMIGTIPPMVPLIKAGRLKVLAIAAPRRSRLVPDVPTVAESGISGVEAYSWNGLMLPAGTHKQIAARLQAEVVKIMQMPDVVEKLMAAGAEPQTTTSQEFARFIAAEMKKYAEVVRESGAKID